LLTLSSGAPCKCDARPYPSALLRFCICFQSRLPAKNPGILDPRVRLGGAVSGAYGLAHVPEKHALAKARVDTGFPMRLAPAQAGDMRHPKWSRRIPFLFKRDTV